MAVRRPRGIEDFVEIRNRNLLLFSAALGIEYREGRMAAGHRANRDAPAGGVPGPGRVNELNARVVGIGRGAGDLANDFAGCRIGKEQIDRQETPLGEERDILIDQRVEHLPLVQRDDAVTDPRQHHRMAVSGKCLDQEEHRRDER